MRRVRAPTTRNATHGQVRRTARGTDFSPAQTLVSSRRLRCRSHSAGSRVGLGQKILFIKSPGNGRYVALNGGLNIIGLDGSKRTGPNTLVFGDVVYGRL